MMDEAVSVCASGCDFENLPYRFRNYMRFKNANKDNFITASNAYTYKISNSNVLGQEIYKIQMMPKNSKDKGMVYKVEKNKQSHKVMIKNGDVPLGEIIYSPLSAPYKMPRTSSKKPSQPDYGEANLGPTPLNPKKPVPPLPPETMKKINQQIEHNEANEKAVAIYKGKITPDKPMQQTKTNLPAKPIPPVAVKSNVGVPKEIIDATNHAIEAKNKRPDNSMAMVPYKNTSKPGFTPAIKNKPQAQVQHEATKPKIISQPSTSPNIVKYIYNQFIAKKTHHELKPVTTITQQNNLGSTSKQSGKVNAKVIPTLHNPLASSIASDNEHLKE